MVLLVAMISLSGLAQIPTSIAITPANPYLGVGQSQQFTALSADATSFSFGQATTVATGALHTCALLANGTVQCWGSNSNGQLGNGGTSNSGSPTTVSGLSAAKGVANGFYHSCAVLSGGGVECWGDDQFGELGDNNNTFIPVTSPVAVSLAPGTTATTVVAGNGYSCALLSNGAVQCWGTNDFGQLGNGSFTNSSTPVSVTGITSAVAIASGAYHVCAVLSGGTVKCWGYNAYGELGDGTTNTATTPVTVTGLTGAKSVSVGTYHSCALLSNNTAKCWGYNIDGELGNGSFAPSGSPVTVSGLTGATAISSGFYQTCAALTNGTAKCWGMGVEGQLGDGTGTNSNTPLTVSGLNTVSSVSGGGLYSCASLANGTVQCWGDNSAGELGNGSLSGGTATPGAVVAAFASKALPSTGAVQISTGRAHACAVLSSGSLQCWGANANGQIGNGNTTTAWSPTNVTGVTNAIAVAAGGYDSCALLANGAASCWGNNTYGQLGNNTTTNSNVAVGVHFAAGTTAASITAGTYFECSLMSDGTVQCWGRNNVGQLGDGNTTNSHVPIAVSGLTGAVAVSAGQSHACALLNTGAVKCWGLGTSGQLGNAKTLNSNVPVTVTGITNAIAIGTGANHSCAVLADGSARCWGFNTDGELGNGGNTNSSTAVTVTGVVGAITIAGGATNTCALTANGASQCWGQNANGQLGNGTTTNSPTAVSVVGLANATAIDAGTSFACALLSDGTPRCWGIAGSGQLGNDDSADRPQPAATFPLGTRVVWMSSNASVASINPLTGLATGVSLGTTTITANYGGIAASTTLNVIVPAAPAFTSANTTTFPVNSASSFAVTASGAPAPTLSESGALPSGVTFNAATGTLAGTPALGTVGSYPVSFTATNGVGSDAVQNFTLVVAQATPVITWATPQPITSGTALSSTQLNATANVPGSFVYNPAAGTVPAAGNATLGVTFTPSDATNYTTAAQSVTLAVTNNATMISPVPGSTLGGTSANFTWTPGNGATQYLLYVGTTSGGAEVANVNTSSTSAIVNGIPANGATLYVSLISLINGAWQPQYYTYTQSGIAAPAQVTSPAPGTKLAGATATFQWSAGTGVTQYLLYVGTAFRANDVFVSSAPVGTTQLAVTGIPAGGANLYVTLYSLINGAWIPQDYTYTEAGTTAVATMSSPANGATLTGSSQTFTWAAGRGITQYLLYIGTTSGAGDVYSLNAPVGTTSAAVSNIPTSGATLYVTLYSKINGAWQTPRTYTYKEAGAPSAATIISPTPGDTLTGSTATFTWTPGGGVTQYLLYVGTTFANNDIYVGKFGQGTTSASVGNIPTYGGPLYVTLKSLINNVWQTRSYTYTEAVAP